MKLFSILILFILATLPTDSFANSSTNTGNVKSILEESQLLYAKGDYIKAIELIEPEYQKGEIEYNFFGGMWSTEEYMSRLYKEAKLVGRGFKYFYDTYNQKIYNKNKRHSLAEVTMDFAILDKKFGKALEILNQRIEQDKSLNGEDIDYSIFYKNYGKGLEIPEQQIEQEYYSVWDIDFARIYAAKGDNYKAIEYIKHNLNSKLSESRTQIIAKHEFVSLYSDPSFQSLVADTHETVRKHQSKLSELLATEEKKAEIKPSEIVNIVEIYKKIINQESLKKYQTSLYEADKKLRPYIEEHKELIFSLIEKGKSANYYRLTLANFLARIGDKQINSRLAILLKEDNFLIYPQQLFYLTYQIARTSPESAKPLLFQMLKGSKGNVFLAEHFTNLNWDALLMQAFGVVETYYKDELLAIAQKNTPIMSNNAMKILVSLQEPRLVSILVNKINSEDNKNKRKELINLVGSLYFPETIIALDKIKNDTKTNNDEVVLITQLNERFNQPPKDIFPNKRGIAIKNRNVKTILLSNLELTHGIDVSFIDKTIFLTVDKSDLKQLYKIRSSILYHLSDESFYDWRTISRIISWLNWQV